MHHIDNPQPGLVADLSSFAIGGWDGGRAGQLHTKTLGQ